MRNVGQDAGMTISGEDQRSDIEGVYHADQQSESFYEEEPVKYVIQAESDEELEFFDAIQSHGLEFSMDVSSDFSREASHSAILRVVD